MKLIHLQTIYPSVISRLSFDAVEASKKKEAHLFPPLFSPILKELKESELKNSPIFIMGNDPLIEEYPKFKDPKKPLVLVGTSCLRNIKIALDLAPDHLLNPPKIYIVDLSKKVHSFWNSFIAFFSKLKKITSESDFQTKEKALSNFHKYLDSFLTRTYLHTTNEEADQTELNLCRHGLEKIKLFFKELTEDGISTSYIIDIISSINPIKQDWAQERFFENLNEVITLEFPKRNVVAYISNISAYIYDTEGIVLKNAFQLNPEFVIASDLTYEPEDIMDKNATDSLGVGNPKNNYFLTRENKKELEHKVIYSQLDMRLPESLGSTFIEGEKSFDNVKPKPFLWNSFDLDKPSDVMRISHVKKLLIHEELHLLPREDYSCLLFFSKTALRLAVEGKIFVPAIIKYLAKHIDFTVFKYFKINSSLFNLAAYNGNVEAMKLLYQLNPKSILAVNDLGETPLHSAAFHSHVECVKFLLQVNNKFVSCEDLEGETPLFYVFRSDEFTLNQSESIRLLIKAGARFDHMNKESETPLFKVMISASESGNLGFLNFCLSYIGENYPENFVYLTASLNELDGGNTPANYAAYNGCLNVLKKLLKINPEIILTKNDYGETLIHRASYNFHTEVADYLLSLKPELIHVEDIEGYTPIYFVIRGDFSKKQLRFMQYLINKGANLNHTNNRGETPLQFALNYENFKLAKLIQENMNKN